MNDCVWCRCESIPERPGFFLCGTWSDGETWNRTAQCEIIRELRTWKDAVEDAAVVRWTLHGGDARAELDALLDREVEIALDPAVSRSAHELLMELHIPQTCPVCKHERTPQ